jgi:hypothetical protein
MTRWKTLPARLRVAGVGLLRKPPIRFALFTLGDGFGVWGAGSVF